MNKKNKLWWRLAAGLLVTMIAIWGGQYCYFHAAEEWVKQGVVCTTALLASIGIGLLFTSSLDMLFDIFD